MDNLFDLAAFTIATVTALVTLAHARSALGFFFWLPLSAAYVYFVFILVPMLAFCAALTGLIASAVYGIATDDTPSFGP